MNKRKYILIKTGEEVKFGDIISYISKKETSFGVIKVIKEYTLTPFNIGALLDAGIIKKVEEDKIASAIKDYDNVGFYLEMLATRMHRSIQDLTEWLESMNKVCPKAVLDILLQEIAIHFYNKNPKAFDDAECYYSLRPRDGKVGKVINTNSYIPLFKSKEDAERARTILKEQLIRMYGTQSE